MRVERARYFATAVKCGSFRAAALELGMSQPALGQQINAFEEELDTVLLTRSRQGVVPTSAGQELLPHIAQLIAAEDALRDEALGVRGAYQGKVKVGCIPILATTLLAPVIGNLIRDHASLRFTVTESTSNRVEADVAQGELDFGVLTQPSSPPPESLERRLMFQLPMYVCTPLGHPLAERSSLTWEDLAPWPIVAMRPGSRLWEYLQANVPHPRVVFEAATANMVRSVVAHGAGIGIDTMFAVNHEIAHVRLSGPDSLIPVCLTQRGNAQSSRSAATVKKLIMAQAEALRTAGTVV